MAASPRTVVVLLPADVPPALVAAMPAADVGANFVCAQSAADVPSGTREEAVGIAFAPGASVAELEILYMACSNCHWVHSLLAGVDGLAPVMPRLASDGATLTRNLS